MKRLSDMLQVALGRGGVLDSARAQAVMRRWKEVVGPVLAEKSEPSKFQRGTLWVSASGSAWAQEIRMLQERILDKMNELAQEDDLFTALRVSVLPPKKALVNLDADAGKGR